LDTFVFVDATSRLDATVNMSYTTSLGHLQSIMLPASVSNSVLNELDGSSCRRLSALPSRLVEPIRASRRPRPSRQAWNETERRLTQELNIGEMKNDFLKILEEGTVDIASVWNVITILFSDVDLIMKDWAVNNILAFSIGIRSFDVTISMIDVDGARLFWSYDPDYDFFFLNFVQTYDDFLVDAAHKGVIPEFVVSVDNDGETMARLYDELVQHDRLCGNVDVVATAYLQSPGQDAYELEALALRIDKLELVGVDACGADVGCEETHDQIFPSASNSGYTLTGSAQLAGEIVELASSTSDGGALWSGSRVSVGDSWAATFDFKVTHGEDCFFFCWSLEGYGFAFVLQNDDGNHAAGGDDSYGGYSGIDNSIAVLFDTLNGNLYVYKNGATGFSEEASVLLPDDADSGTWQSAKIVYSSVAGIMWIYVQNMDVAVTWLRIDMDFSDDGQAYVGFTASNRWTEASKFEIQNIVVEGAATIAQHSRIIEDGLTIGSSGSLASFTAASYTSCDRQKLSGGDSWFFDLVKGSETISVAPESSVPHDIRDDGDGTYYVRFLAAAAGTWTVNGATSSGATKQAIGTVVVSER